MKKIQTQSNIRHLPYSTAQDPNFLNETVQKYYDKWEKNHPMKGQKPGPDSILVRSNDYLCISGDKRLVKAEIRALRKMGHGDAASRIWGFHQKDLMREFELRMAKLMKAEDGVLCNSGYCANIGLVQSIATPETPIYIDMKAHMSLWEGISSAKATPIPFRHNDPNHLERNVKKNGPGIIIVDSLYSTDGNLAPLTEIVEIAEKYGCATIVDETHSFGTHGPNGAGLVVKMGLANRVQFRTIGLSKAVASRGGIVICSKRNAEFFRYVSFPTIFSTSVMMHEAAGYNAVLDILASDDWRRKRLHKNHEFLRKGLLALGYNVQNCLSQIISLEAGEIQNTINLRNLLEANDIFGSVFLTPAVPEKRTLIRLSINCNLSQRQLNHILSVCKNIREEAGVFEWRSTKRMQNHLKYDAA